MFARHIVGVVVPLLMVSSLRALPPQNVQPRIPIPFGKHAELVTLEKDLASLLKGARELRVANEPKHQRPLLPPHAWPLSLGRAEATRIVQDALEGRQVIVIPGDQEVYYGGGIVARPQNAFNTTITINWQMIADELAVAAESDRRLKEMEKQAEEVLGKIRKLQGP